jgi:hypothetical protein
MYVAHVPVPLHAPPRQLGADRQPPPVQPAKVELAFGVAVRVTVVPEL